MPVYRRRIAFEIGRGIKAFLNLEAGFARGATPPNFEQMFKRAQKKVRQKNQQVRQMRRQLTDLLAGETQNRAENTYEALYEVHARDLAPFDEAAVGPGPFDLIGRLELQILLTGGLKPTNTLLDLGCGTGRLAVHAIPILVGGRYVGTDISQTMLDEAQRLVREAVPDPRCEITWAKQTTPAYPLPADSVDMICAFSVFTHMEHEDTYRYLKEALRIVRPGGYFVLSCLPMNLELARKVFVRSTEVDLKTRWGRVRNVTTSVDFMTEIASLAGWKLVRWYDGEEQNIRLPDTAEPQALGQSVCVLQAPGKGATKGVGG